MLCHESLNREFKLADYLTVIKEPFKRQTLSKYRLSDHKLTVETGQFRNQWLETSESLLALSHIGQVGTEIYFLITCPNYVNV